MKKLYKNFNIKNLNKLYSKKRFLSNKDFSKLNQIVFGNNELINEKLYEKFDENAKSSMVGMVLESGFWTNYFWFNPIFFKQKSIRFPYKKIVFLEKINKNLKDSFLKRVYFRMSNNKSYFCIAGAGSGKTQGIVLPSVYANAIGAKPNMVITDPKAEIYKASFIFLKKAGYNVRIINMIDGKNTDCFSPFTEIKKWIYQFCQYPEKIDFLPKKLMNEKIDLKEMITDEIQTLTRSIISKDNKFKEDFWEKLGLDSMKLIIWYIIDDLELEYRDWLLNNKSSPEDNKRKNFDNIFIKLNFQSIYETAASLTKDEYLNWYASNFEVDLKNETHNSNFFKKNHPGVIQWKQILGGSENVAANISVVVTKQLQIFNSPLLKNLTIYNTFSLDDLTGFDTSKKPIVLFLVINNSEPKTLGYAAWFLNYIIMKMQTFAISGKNEKLKKPLLFLLEEIGNLPIIENLPILINEGRGKNMIAALIFQNFEQYSKKYGDSGILRSCEYRVFLTNAEAKFSDELVEYSGTYSDWNEKRHEFTIKERMSHQDISSLPPKMALIQHLSTNIPYRSYLLPFHFLNKKKIDEIKINIDDPIFLSKQAQNPIYSPLISHRNNILPTIKLKEILNNWNLINTLTLQEAYNTKEILNNCSHELIFKNYNIILDEQILNLLDEKIKVEKLKKIEERQNQTQIKFLKEDKLKSFLTKNKREINSVDKLIFSWVPKKYKNLLIKQIDEIKKNINVIPRSNFNFNIDNLKDMLIYIEKIINDENLFIYLFQYNFDIPNFELIFKAITVLKDKNIILFYFLNTLFLTKSINFESLSKKEQEIILADTGVENLRASVHFFVSLFLASKNNDLSTFFEKNLNRSEIIKKYFDFLNIIINTNFSEGISEQIKNELSIILKEKNIEFYFKNKLNIDFDI